METTCRVLLPELGDANRQASYLRRGKCDVRVDEELVIPGDSMFLTLQHALAKTFLRGR